MAASLATSLVLLISLGNLSSLVYALFATEHKGHDPQLIGLKLAWATPLAMILAFLSQALYLTLLAAWAFHWARFYPGAPIYRTNSLGLACSFVGMCSALAGTGAKRWASLFVSLTTGFLWFLSLIVSAAA